MVSITKILDSHCITTETAPVLRYIWLRCLYMVYFNPEKTDKKIQPDSKDVISLDSFREKRERWGWGGQKEMYQPVHSGTLGGETGRIFLLLFVFEIYYSHI